jgi:hypothetical protein
MAVSPVKTGLAQIVKRLPSVKNCTLTLDGVLSANLWSGAAVQIHDLDAPIKIRQIKKILQDVARMGIGAMFVVNAVLLPPDGERTEPADWLQAIHELSGERIYTYRLQDGKLLIGQVHFKPFGGNLREVWYGPDVIPSGLPFFRVWVKMPALRGDWLIGNFGNDLFWKQQDFRTQRAAEQQQYNGQRIHNWSSERVYSAYADQSMPLLQLGKLELALKTLGVKEEATEEEVKAAFRKLARECHPDVSRLPKDEAEHRFRAITEAYAYIRQTNGW